MIDDDIYSNRKNQVNGFRVIDDPHTPAQNRRLVQIVSILDIRIIYKITLTIRFSSPTPPRPSYPGTLITNFVKFSSQTRKRKTVTRMGGKLSNCCIIYIPTFTNCVFIYLSFILCVINQDTESSNLTILKHQLFLPPKQWHCYDIFVRQPQCYIKSCWRSRMFEKKVTVHQKHKSRKKAMTWIENITANMSLTCYDAP